MRKPPVIALLGGGQLGFNYQAGKWVAGIEADYSFANVDGDGIYSNTITAGAQRLPNVASVRTGFLLDLGSGALSGSSSHSKRPPALLSAGDGGFGDDRCMGELSTRTGAIARV